MNALVAELKQAGEDFEFYPTSNEIIAAVIADITRLKEDRYDGHCNRPALRSVLDIGAGNGKVLRAFREARVPVYNDSDRTVPVLVDFYAIEKSNILCEQLDESVFIVGTEFYEQSLVSKAVDVTFCNPPYREFCEWSTKIIRESASHVIYLVIPVRWQESLEISAALRFRDAKAKILGEYSFEHAEDRQARARVHLLRITFPTRYDAPDAFERFFDEQFAELKTKFEGTRTDRNRDGERSKFSALVVGPSYPERMVELYNAELDHVRKNYDLVAKLDVDLLKEFDVTPDRILGCLKARLAGLRNLYWRELIGNVKQVTDRLCSKKRQMLLDKLNESGHVDFTVSNIHAIVIWILKNANHYIDEQLCETFEKMIGKANVRNYASNKRVFIYDRWRYQEEKPTHIALEYRLVLDRCGGLGRNCNSRSGLSNEAEDFIGDLLTVSRNLGFDCNNRSELRAEWTSGQKHIFTIAKRWKVGEKVPWSDKTRKAITDQVQLEDGSFQYEVDGQWLHERCLPGEPLLEVRAFSNSNLHIRLNQKLALAMNVEVGRLKGWLRDAKEAVDELGDREAGQYFEKQVRLGTGSLLLLTGPTAA